MGWSTETDVHTKQDLINLINRAKYFSDPFEVLGTRSGLSGVWVLYKNPKSGLIFVSNYLTSIEDGELHYKEVSESDGILQLDCPLGFINKSTTTDDYSVKWKAKVREFHSAKDGHKEKAKPGAAFNYGGQLYKLLYKRTSAMWMCDKLSVIDKIPLGVFNLISTRQLQDATYL